MTLHFGTAAGLARRLDPDYPVAPHFSLKISRRDAGRVRALAQRDGITVSAALRYLVCQALDDLDAEDAGRRKPAAATR